MTVGSFQLPGTGGGGGGQGRVSEISDDFGNSISANGDCVTLDIYTPWTLDGYTLAYNPDNHSWIGGDDAVRYVVERSEYTPDTWLAGRYEWNGETGEWNLVASSSTDGALDATELYFTSWELSATRTVYVADKLATEGYVQGVVGDIESALHEINYGPQGEA